MTDPVWRANMICLLIPISMVVIIAVFAIAAVQ
jgi:hypothetical protein